MLLSFFNHLSFATEDTENSEKTLKIKTERQNQKSFFCVLNPKIVFSICSDLKLSSVQFIFTVKTF